MIQTWYITSTGTNKVEIAASTLDEVTRQLPEGFYSTFRTFDGCRRVLGLTAHLGRLYTPASTSEVDASALRRQLRALLESHCPGEARVRIMMTKQGQAYISIEPLKELPCEVYEKGVRVETTELQRQQPRLKSTGFISRSQSERKHIAQEGIFEALLVKDGKILEGMTSNFFYIHGDVRNEKILCTARADILLGITRKTVIDIARSRALKVKYKPLKRDQLPAVQEAFITSSSRGIVPVIQIDSVAIGQGSPGAITRELITGYQAYVLEKSERI